jgi:hypothetical protein
MAMMPNIHISVLPISTYLLKKSTYGLKKEPPTNLDKIVAVADVVKKNINYKINQIGEVIEKSGLNKNIENITNDFTQVIAPQIKKIDVHSNSLFHNAILLPFSNAAKIATQTIITGGKPSTSGFLSTVFIKSASELPRYISKDELSSCLGQNPAFVDKLIDGFKEIIKPVIDAAGLQFADKATSICKSKSLKEAAQIYKMGLGATLVTNGIAAVFSPILSNAIENAIFKEEQQNALTSGVAAGVGATFSAVANITKAQALKGLSPEATIAEQAAAVGKVAQDVAKGIVENPGEACRAAKKILQTQKGSIAATIVGAGIYKFLKNSSESSDVDTPKGSPKS